MDRISDSGSDGRSSILRRGTRKGFELALGAFLVAALCGIEHLNPCQLC